MELTMNKPKGMPSNEIIAEVVARKVFAKRGNHSEAHISELELAAIINAALVTYESTAEVFENGVAK
jgi:hypothetical protein